MKKLSFLLFSTLVLCTGILAQDSLSWIPVGNKPSHRVSKLAKGFSLNGYYRFYAIHRNLEEGWPVLSDNQFANTPPYVFGAGDVYRDPPIMLMTASVRPGGGASISMDYALYSNFTNSNGNVPYNLNLGISLYGTVPVRGAKVGFQLGGINWTEVSGMTFSSWPGYDRFSLFERWAWEGIGQASERAANFIATDRISREERWARQAMKGAIIDLYELPAQFSGRLLYGKSPVSASLEDNINRYTIGGRVRKGLGNGNFVGVNTMNYVQAMDSIGLSQAVIGLHTINVNYAKDFWSIRAEGGIGESYTSGLDETQRQSGEGLRLNFAVDSTLFGIPMEFEYFRLSPEFTNFFGNFLSVNTQFMNAQSLQNVGGGGGAANFVGSITDVGQVLNNRQGYTLNAWFKRKNMSLNVGLMNSREMERLTNRLSFGHKIAGQTLSRFAPFATGVGPYRRWVSFYRGVAEELFITDVDEEGLPPELLGFSTLQLQYKQKFEVKGHPFYLLNVNSFGSANGKALFFPDFSDDAYLRTLYSETDFIFPLGKVIDITLGFGIERIRGNSQTNNIYYLDQNGNLAGANLESNDPIEFVQLDGTLIPLANYEGASSIAEAPLNQTSQMFGWGVDVRLSPQSGLYIRQRRFSQKDENFTADNIEGVETTVELKIFF